LERRQAEMEQREHCTTVDANHHVRLQSESEEM
jgi:hypothetical protein